MRNELRLAVRLCRLYELRGAPAGTGVGGGIAEHRANLALAALPHLTAPLTPRHLRCPPATTMTGCFQVKNLQYCHRITV